MDLDYLHQRQQAASYMAERATCESAREAHRGLAEGYAAMIAAARKKQREEAAQ
jgi:hypothetical protein